MLKLVIVGNDNFSDDKVLVFINEDFTEQDAIDSAWSALGGGEVKAVIEFTPEQEAALEGVVYVGIVPYAG